ncbi:hypothetical protein [Cupriavidus sp. DL-D2]|uniref:hypothetical protein n=1 Tax=Cupriavidus sp. DL-D2 TaxID=3144974 RepID=UPI0032143749
MAQESQSTEYLCDFVYLDRDRAALYFAQLDPENGTPTQVKRTEKHGGQDADKLTVGIPKLMAKEYGGGTQFERSIEGQYDPSWLIPIEVMNRLDELSYITTDLEQARIGRMALLTGSMRVIDVRFLKELWPYVGDMIAKQASDALPANTPPKVKQQTISHARKETDLMSGVISKMPHSLQASFTVQGKRIWTTLRPDNMLMNPEDLALKHGADIPGEWRLLGIIDALPELSSPSPSSAPEGFDLEGGLVNIINTLRTFMGRQSGSFGITPIAIFRTIKPV